MTFKQYLLVMTLGTLAALLSWTIVLVAIDPMTSGIPAKVIFFLSFFIAAVGVFSLFGALIRVLIVHREGVVSREVARAFRQSLLFSSIILSNLILAAANYLRWWTLIITVLLFAFIELFFLTAGERNR